MYFLTKSRSSKFEYALIKQVRMYPCLYQTAIKEYRNKEAKNEIWWKISTVLNTPVADCQNRWRSLRDRFVREVTKNKQLIEEGHEVTSKYKFYDEMCFLKPFLYPSRKKYVLSIKGADADDGATKFTVNEETNCDYTQFTSLKRKHSSDNDSHEESTILCQKRKSQKVDKIDSKSEANFDFMAVGSMNNTDNADSFYDEKEEEEVAEFEKKPTVAENHSTEMIDHKEFERERKQLARINKKLNITLKSISQYLTYKMNKTKKPSPNAPFLTMLDEYLMRLSPDRREHIKMKILNNVYSKIYETKSNCKPNKSKN